MPNVGDDIIKGLDEAVEFLEGKTPKARVHKVVVPDDIDVAAIRKATGLSQQKFCDRFGFSLGTLHDWEQKRRRPTGAARVLLLVIAKEPEAVDRVLARAG